MPFRQQTIKQAFMLLSLFAILLAGCADMSPILSKQTAVPPTNQMLTPSQTYELKSRLPTETHLPTESPALPTSTQISEPKGCREPQGNYDRIVINGHQLNQRTYEMLTYAAEIYKGIIDITGEAITQGSYTGAVEASFGTHSGGGAVDLSVMAAGTYQILDGEIEPLVTALRLAGFAAWYRDFDELYPGSPVHIHAIAIGDRELSLPAREQLAGPHGYFWGYNGLPAEVGDPARDPHGGPIMCDWMSIQGYPNKTATPSPSEDLP